LRSLRWLPERRWLPENGRQTLQNSVNDPLT
jgi:hypothetical protein